MKKTYLDALMSIFTPIPLNNGFYFVDNNGTIDWILSNIFLRVRATCRGGDDRYLFLSFIISCHRT
jgi:hypothetical protein